MPCVVISTCKTLQTWYCKKIFFFFFFHVLLSHINFEPMVHIFNDLGVKSTGKALFVCSDLGAKSMVKASLFRMW